MACCRVTVLAEGTSSLQGSYRLEVLVKDAATELDRTRLTVETMMLEDDELRKQPARGSQVSSYVAGQRAAIGSSSRSTSFIVSFRVGGTLPSFQR